MTSVVSLRVVDTGEGTAQFNMDWDEAQLEAVDHQGGPLLHLYRWKGDCATYGYFVKPQEVLNIDAVKRLGLALGKRPTGGGVIFHLTDLAFSFFIPAGHPGYSSNILDNYRFIHQVVVTAIAQFLGEEAEAQLLAHEGSPLDSFSQHFCMAKPTKFDVMLKGKKVGGAAQRRKRGGFLHQGSISLAPPPTHLLEEVLYPQSRVLEAMKANSFYLLGGNASTQELEVARRELTQALIAEAGSRL